jgi:hypothetical protein
MSRWARIDFKEFKELHKKIERMADSERERICTEIAELLAARFLRDVRKRTPVGVPPDLPPTSKPKTAKLTGKRGETAEGFREQYWAAYKGGQLRRGWSVGEVTRSGDAYTVEIINNEDYASYVEYGHTQTPGRYVPLLGKALKRAWVPGKYMMTITRMDIQNKSPGIVSRMLKTKLMELLN